MISNTDLSDDKSTFTITIKGKFDFNLRKEFRSAYMSQKNINKFVIDLSSATYVDSSALGMLLILKDHADEHKYKVLLSRPSKEIKELLILSNFNKIFDIE